MKGAQLMMADNEARQGTDALSPTGAGGLATRFVHRTDVTLDGHLITLTRLEDGKEKVFFLAGPIPRGRLVSHMNSLTDNQCEDFFKEVGDARPKKVKPPAHKVPAMTWVLDRAQRAYAQEEGCLIYYDGLQLFWLHHEGLRYLAMAVPSTDDSKTSLVLTEMSDKQAQKLLEGEWTLLSAVRQGKRWLFVDDYCAAALAVSPLPRVPKEWLPGDVVLEMPRKGSQE